MQVHRVHRSGEDVSFYVSMQGLIDLTHHKIQSFSLPASCSADMSAFQRTYLCALLQFHRVKHTPAPYLAL
jgi:hypothetical protein